MSTRLRSESGTCKQSSVVSEGTSWTIELDCSKGRLLTLSIHLDAHDVIDGIGFRPRQGTGMRCPTRSWSGSRSTRLHRRRSHATGIAGPICSADQPFLSTRG
jgi:hypothetical protein